MSTVNFTHGIVYDKHYIQRWLKQQRVFLGDPNWKQLNVP